MPIPPRALLLVPVLCALLAGCGRDDTGSSLTPEMPVFQEEGLVAGRSVWMGTCRNCHLLGVAGAPAVTDGPEWDRRLPKGREALYRSALGGIKGKDGDYRMPPHGGNPRLSEDQVRLAVDYMVAAVESLRDHRP